MDDLYYKIQIYLQKKDQECGCLKFLTSRTTTESIKHINEICESVAEFLKTFKVPLEDSNLKDNQSCIEVYKYLMLNTAFNSQTYLVEDIVNGHLADMCPPLSPYLFLEILLHLKFEEILAESILYVPLDLCVEILEISRRLFESVDFNRGFSILIILISNGYKKFIITKNSGSQTSCFEEFLERLVSAIQELISLLFNERVMKFSEISDLEKFERYGIVLKKVLEIVRQSLEIDEINLLPEREKLYKITFGNQSPVKGDEKLIQRHLEELRQELINLLLKKIKEIDFKIYLGWTEFDYKNTSVSLQQSIGFDCFHLAEALKNCDELSKLSKHLIECLNQLASNPNMAAPLSTLSLEELCIEAKEKKEYFKELMKRYKDWTKLTFEYIEKSGYQLESEDCLYLLEYLHSIILQPEEEAYKQKVYGYVCQTLFTQPLTDLFSISIDFILNHNGSTNLELEKLEENFESFTKHSITFESVPNLRFVLISIIKSPKKILSILLKIVIGHPAYENVMLTPNELFLLAPILKIRTENGKTLLANTLGECMQQNKWNIKKFAHFVQVMEENGYGVDEIFNDIFIPYLESETLKVSNIRSVLNCIRKMIYKCTDKLETVRFMQAIVKRTSYFRNDTDLPKYVNGEILSMLIKVTNVLFHDKFSLFNEDKKILIDDINIYLQPIDRPYFASLYHLSKQGVDVRDIMEDYERRCFIVMNEVRTIHEICGKLRQYYDDFSFLHGDFLRHLILKSTELEYVQFGKEAILIHWDVFKWKNEIDAFDKFVQITIDACLLCLEFPFSVSKQSFPFLLKCLARLSLSIFKLNMTQTYKSIYESLNQGIKRLNDSIKTTQFSELYVQFLTSVNNLSSKQLLADILHQFIDLLHNFGCQCFEPDLKSCDVNKQHSPEVIKFKFAHDFISDTIKVSVHKAYIYLTNIEEFLFPKDSETEKEKKT